MGRQFISLRSIGYGIGKGLGAEKAAVTLP